MKADYEEHDAILIARCMMQIKAKFDTDEGLNFIQQDYINQGLKKFGDDGKDAVDKELRKMLLRDCFTPEFVKDMTASERKKRDSGGPHAHNPNDEFRAAGQQQESGEIGHGLCRAAQLDPKRTTWVSQASPGH
ncbi:unnamed protein product [Cylindrotheca closterium]|uniref:Uncharacterized protein n=1 Tax=Cylindrotheca closterium TaxID=2856 RepID=A0AAD2G0N8_9STRA|nr:unnamed protein product [Cylindrotheca closterium]